MVNIHNTDFSLGSLVDCPVEMAVKNGFQKKRYDPYDSVTEIKKVANEGVESPLIAAFGLNKNGE